MPQPEADSDGNDERGVREYLILQQGEMRVHLADDEQDHGEDAGPDERVIGLLALRYIIHVPGEGLEPTMPKRQIYSLLR